MIGTAALYACVCAFLYLMQDRMLFPAHLVAANDPLPPQAERLSLPVSDDIALEGVYLAPLDGGGKGELVIAFSGNATNAQTLATRLRRALPGQAVAAFHYRGYAPSGGTPSAAAVVEDASRIFDFLVARYRPRRLIGIGVSLGSGVAASLAAARPLDRLILVTPFDSLSAVAADQFRFLPVSLLIRHDIDSVAALRDRRVAVALVRAGDDTLVTAARTDPLKSALADPRADIVLEGAGHSDILGHPGFDDAMRAALVSLSAPTGR